MAVRFRSAPPNRFWILDFRFWTENQRPRFLAIKNPKSRRAADRENSLCKANKLADMVNAFRQAIENEAKAFDERTAMQHIRASAAVH
jgi:hypothetical protein